MTPVEPTRPHKAPPPLVIRYKNYKGEIATRRIVPLYPWYGKTAWHPHEDQWLLRCLDEDKREMRDFSMKDMLGAPDATDP